MPKYQVTIVSNFQNTYIIEVEADDVAEGKEQALQVLHAGGADPISFAVIDDEITHVGMTHAHLWQIHEGTAKCVECGQVEIKED